MELTKEKKEMIIKTIEVRLNGVTDATKRGRFAFLVVTIASCAILITLWNAYFSYTRTMAFEKDPASVNTNSNIMEQRQLPLHEHNRRVVVAEWAKNLNVRIDLLGLGINVNEFSLLGSFTLTIISLWYFFSLRRENRAIVLLLRDVVDDLNTPIDLLDRKDDKWDIANLAFHGVAQSLIFINTGLNDKPLSSDDIFKNKDEDNTNIAENVDNANNASNSTGTIDKFVKILTKAIRALALFLTFLPVITIFLAIVADYYSLSLISPFRDLSKPLREVMPPTAFRQFLWENIVAFILGGLTLMICFACVVFQLRTSQALKAFELKLYPKP